MMVWFDLSCRYRVATDFLTSWMCLLSFVAVLHFSFTACFTNDSDADRITFGCCLTARCAIAFTALYPSYLLLLGSYVKTTRLPSSSTRLACLLISMMIGST
jgi:hypothetical protein